MFIRRKQNRSGTISIQVVDKRGGSNVVLKSFGASKSEEELKVKEHEASEYITTYGGQMTLNLSMLSAQEQF